MLNCQVFFLICTITPHSIHILQAGTIRGGGEVSAGCAPSTGVCCPTPCFAKATTSGALWVSFSPAWLLPRLAQWECKAHPRSGHAWPFPRAMCLISTVCPWRRSPSKGRRHLLAMPRLIQEAAMRPLPRAASFPVVVGAPPGQQPGHLPPCPTSGPLLVQSYNRCNLLLI